MDIEFIISKIWNTSRPSADRIPRVLSKKKGLQKTLAEAAGRTQQEKEIQKTLPGP